MLLRLLPLPTSTSPSPPTILFTLSSPTNSSSSASPYNPYTPHHLPAPPALVSHHQICKANDFPCPTLLTGESSSWINTIVAEVTFLPSIGEIQILLVDGSGVVMPLRETGAGKTLDKVRDHVLESGRLMERAAAAASAQGGGERLGSMKKGGESMLMSIFSPLIGGPVKKEDAAGVVATQSREQQQRGRELSARQHRRLARSSLVDCYRRWVLLGLKALLPPTYLLFISQSTLQTHSNTLSKTELELRVLLSIAGQPFSSPPSSPSLSDSELPKITTTPLPFPPSAALPSHLRASYASHLSAHVETSATIASLERLARKHEREERRNSWDDSLPAVQRRNRTAPNPVCKERSPLHQAWIATASALSSASSSPPSYTESGVPPLSPTNSLWSSSSSSSDSFDNSSSDGEDEEAELQVVTTPREEPDDYSYSLEEVKSMMGIEVRFDHASDAERGERRPLDGLGLGDVCAF